MKKIAVIGGGITGLTAAFRLSQDGFHPLLFEKGEQAGGSVQTSRSEGFQIEAGPNSLQDSPADVAELIRLLGLEGEVIEAAPAAKNRYILRSGNLVALPTSPPALLRSKVLSWPAKLRLFREPFVGRPPEGKEESLADFTRRRLGPEVLDYLVNPFIGGIYAGDPEQLSVQYAMPKLFQLERDHGSLFGGMRAAAKKRKAEGGKRGMPRLISFRHGLASLTDELANRLRKNIYLETTVESITAREGKWEVIASRYGRRIRDNFDAVVLALPPKTLAAVAIHEEAGEPSDALRPLDQISHPPVASVSLGFDRDQIGHPLDGFGALFPEKEGRRILGVLFPSTLFPGRAPEGQILLTAFVGGTRQPDLARLPENELVQLAVRDLAPILDIRGEPRFSSVRAWPYSIPQYEVGHGRFVQMVDAFESTHPGIFVAGSSRDGIALGQCIASGFRHAVRAKEYLT